MNIRVGHFGARMYYGIPRALNSIGMLERVYTDFTVNKGLPKILSEFGPFKKMRNRFVPDIPASKIVHLPDNGLSHVLKMRKVRNEDEINRLNFEYGRRLERSMMTDDLKGIDAVTMVGSSSQFIFARAKQLGLKTISEQIIAPGGTYLNILDKYVKDYSDWEKIKTTGSSLRFWQEVSLNEWKHTDHLICGSEFVKESVREFGVPEEKLTVIPYGVPVKSFASLPLKSYDGQRKLRILFVGSVCLRKGIQYLLEIAPELSASCEIRICGGVELTDAIVEKYKPYVSFEGHISRERIGEFYEWADLFVLPTLFEGSATVCYEAIQYSLPMITTRNSGVFLNDGDGASIIPVGDSVALKNAIMEFQENPARIEQYSAALERVKSFASFEAYSERLKSFFKTKVSSI